MSNSGLSDPSDGATPPADESAGNTPSMDSALPGYQPPPAPAPFAPPAAMVPSPTAPVPPTVAMPTSPYAPPATPAGTPSPYGPATTAGQFPPSQPGYPTTQPAPQQSPLAYSGQYGLPTQSGYPTSGSPVYAPWTPPQPTEGLAIASLVVGIASIASIGIISFLAIIPGATALVLGLCALSRIKKTGRPGKGMAIGGISTGGVGLALGLAAIFFLAWFLTGLGFPY